jgi:hypothetical protein
MPKEPKIPAGAIFAKQPKDLKGAEMTPAQLKMLKAAYYTELRSVETLCSTI